MGFLGKLFNKVLDSMDNDPKENVIISATWLISMEMREICLMMTKQYWLHSPRKN